MDRIEPNSYVRTSFGEEKWFSAKAGGEARQAISAIVPEMTEIYQKIMDLLNQGKEAYLLRKLLAKTIFPLAVLNEIEKVMTAFRKQNNVVHISEFNARIAGIVMNEPVPFIYERLGEKYAHILIDEFQDTSVLQWLNFIPLIENSLAGGNFNLVVGDGKQAIYRWRGGEVSQFSALPAIPGSSGNPILRQRELALRRHYRSVDLDTNYRSRAEIVGFNNRFFRVIADTVLTGTRADIYKNLEQKYLPHKTGGYADIRFIHSNADETYADRMLSETRSIINDALESGYRKRDIAVLCRNNLNASTVARFLLEQGIQVVSSDSLLLRNSPGVRFLISCLRFLFQPDNEVIREEIRSFLKGRTTADGELAEIPRGRYEFLPLYDLSEGIIRDFGLGMETDPFLQFFLGAILRFTVQISTDPVEFLEWWDKNERKQSILVPEELDAVRVMSIHKSKGLEFPVVILAYADDTRKNTRQHLWVDLEEDVAPGLPAAILRTDSEMEGTVFQDILEEEKQKSMLDMVNLLYVALTRAEERLYILTRKPPAKADVIQSLPAFFRLFLQMEGVWTDEETHYVFGVPEAKMQSTETETVPAIRPDLPRTTEWRSRIRIRRRAAQGWNIDDPESSTHRGTRIHTLLSWLSHETLIQEVISKGLRSGLIGEEDRAEAERVLLSVVSHPDLRHLFREGVTVKAEAEILLPDGTFFRPDRVVFDGNRVVILDYKTGKAKPEHDRQMEQYCDCLRKMGHHQISSFLVYLEPKVRVVKGDW